MSTRATGGVPALSAAQRNALGAVLLRLQQTGWNRQQFQKEIAAHAEVLNRAFPEDADLFTLGRELEHSVRWTRLAGHCLAFAFQYLSLQRRSGAFVLAASLYADSQAVIGDDLAISSLESAWSVAQRNYPGATGLLESLKLRLRLALDSYERRRARFAFEDCNPLSEHLYSRFSYEWMRQAREPGGDGAYAEIAGHRFEGLEQEASGAWERALAEYDAGLAAAREAGLEPEVGHLLRHRGHALRCLGRHAESVQAFEEACAWEAAPPFLYWRALSQHELGLSLGYCARSRSDLAKSMEAFRQARGALAACLATAMPEVRDVHQELARVFHENALNVAVTLEEPADTLALLEACGPRQVTEAVAETIPRWLPKGVAAEDLRKARGAYYRQMHTYAQGIGQYLAGLPENYVARKQYLVWRGSMTAPLALIHDSDLAAKLLLQSKVQGSVFILPHIGMKRSWVTAVDMETHRVRTLHTDEFTAPQAERAHQEFRTACLAKNAAPRDDSARLRALDSLLETYARWFVPLVRDLLEQCPARRIRFFSHEDMSPVPLHALPWGAGRLLDEYEVSYGQTLALWLLGRERPTAPAASPLLAVDAGGLPFYAAALSGFAVLRQPSWQELLTEVNRLSPANLLFACHGSFDPAEPGNSGLQFGSPSGVSFYKIFSELALERSGGVILGACDSGLSRSRVGAECCGLQLAFLAAGARDVVAAQWPVNQLATALLMQDMAGRLTTCTIPQALRAAQVRVRGITAEEAAQWLETVYAAVDPALAPHMAALIRKRGPHPFEHPYYWAGFTSMGGD